MMINDFLEKDLTKFLANDNKLSKPGGIFLLNTLFDMSDKDKFLEKKIVSALKNFISQREILKNEASKIEIIVGQQEYSILCEFDINSLTHVISPDAIEKKINKVLNDDYYLVNVKNCKIDIVIIFLSTLN